MNTAFRSNIQPQPSNRKRSFGLHGGVAPAVQPAAHPAPARQARPAMMDPNDLIDSIVDAIDYAEIAQDAQGLMKARRLLNNDLRQAIDMYVQDEVHKAVHGSAVRG